MAKRRLKLRVSIKRRRVKMLRFRLSCKLNLWVRVRLKVRGRVEQAPAAAVSSVAKPPEVGLYNC